MDKADAIRATARNLNDLIVDTTPASLTGSTIDALKLIHPNSLQLQGKDFYIFSGGGAGQERIVGTLDAGNRRIFFEEVFGTIPSINSEFVIFDYWQKDAYDNAIDRMAGVARQFHLEEKVATMEFVPTQYEYIVPSGYEYITNLRLVPSGWTNYGADDEVSRIFEIPSRFWRIESNALGSFVIAIDRRKIDLNGFDNQWVNIIGQAESVIEGSDNSTIPRKLEEYIIAGATADLASQRIIGSQQDEWRIKFSIHNKRRDELEEVIFTYRRGKRVGP